jgi:hypothetical protein
MFWALVSRSDSAGSLGHQSSRGSPRGAQMMLMDGDFLNAIQIQMVSYSNGYLILFDFFGIYFDMVKNM